MIRRRHAAAKLIAALVLLVSISTLTEHAVVVGALYLLLMIVVAAVARVPVMAMLLRAAAVLPFALTFAAVTAIAGEPGRAAMLIARGYLSACAAVLLISTTPVAELMAGLEFLRAPEFLLQVTQFLYRYLAVLMREASAMRQAGEARGGRIRLLQFRGAASAVGVLFARSWMRAQAIHRAMMSRGFEGRMPGYRRARFGLSDAGFVAVAAIVVIGVRVGLRVGMK